MQQAETAYQDGYSLAQELEIKRRKPNCFTKWGGSAQNDPRGSTPSAYYEVAMPLASTAPTSRLRTSLLQAQRTAYRALGDAQRVSGDLDRAESSYNEALTASLAQNDRPGAGELYFILGMLAADSGLWDKALGNYALALDLMDSPQMQAHRHDVQTYQASVYLQLGDAQRAADKLEAAAAAYTASLDGANELDDNVHAGLVLYRLGQLDAAQDNWEQALAYFRDAETRLGVEDSETRLDLAGDIAAATRALNRVQLAKQLEQAHWPVQIANGTMLQPPMVLR